MASDVQRASALQLANEKRSAVRNLKMKLEGGSLTLADVLLPSPMPSVVTFAVVDVVRWVPKYGEARQRRLGELAIEADVNLLTPVGQMSRSNREWVAEAVVPQAAMTPAERSRLFRERQVVQLDDVADRLGRVEKLLERARRERDMALQRVAEMEAAVRGRQMVMPTVQAERMLAELADVVEEHKRGLTGSAPNFADADQCLWDAKDQILASDACLRSAA